MNRLLKFIGILTLIAVGLYAINFLVNNFSETIDLIAKWFGIISFILLVGFLVIRLFYGGKWIIEAPKALIVGSDLIKAFENFLSELPKPSKATIANLSGHLVYRFTRIGIFAFIIALIPSILLWQQNRKFDLQNELIVKQNKKIDKQNYRLDQQTFLNEAERRSSLVFLLSNILDALDSELRDNEERIISEQLIARIIALSNNLKPYKYLEGDSLSNKLISPERGHFLVSILESNLNKNSLNNIFQKANFEYSDLRDIKINSAYLRHARLNHSIFSGSVLLGADFTNCELKNVSFQNADLRFSILNYISVDSLTNFKGTNLSGAYFNDTPLGIRLYSPFPESSWYHNAEFSKAILKDLDIEQIDSESKKKFTSIHSVFSNLSTSKRSTLFYYFYEQILREYFKEDINYWDITPRKVVGTDINNDSKYEFLVFFNINGQVPAFTGISDLFLFQEIEDPITGIIKYKCIKELSLGNWYSQRELNVSLDSISVKNKSFYVHFNDVSKWPKETPQIKPHIKISSQNDKPIFFLLGTEIEYKTEDFQEAFNKIIELADF